MNIYATQALKKAHPSDAAFDITTDEDCLIQPSSKQLISTGLRLAIPVGYCGILKARSGLACRGIEVGAGVIDAGYRGEVKVLLMNRSTEAIEIKANDRIAQLMVVAVPEIEWIVSDDLPEADRGVNGFGSTGA